MENTIISDSITIQQAVDKYLSILSDTRSAHTARTYHNGLNAFLISLKDHGLPPDKTPASKLTEDAIAWLANDLKGLAPASERLYLTSAARFYEFLVAERMAALNLTRLKLLIQTRARRPGVRLPQFPQNIIEILLEYATNLTYLPADAPEIGLRNLRDRAFLITLADTGLRVHEACELHRGDIDWNEGRAIIIGKGDRQAVVRFSHRSLNAIHTYLSARSSLDGASGRPLTSLPLFARHDKGAGRKVKPITTTTGRNIVTQRVREALGTDFVGLITPHSLRHYFVTMVLRASGNLKLAQELARHQNIAVTQRYAHISNDELDKGYYDIFDKK